MPFTVLTLLLLASPVWADTGALSDTGEGADTGQVEDTADAGDSGASADTASTGPAATSPAAADGPSAALLAGETGGLSCSTAQPGAWLAAAPLLVLLLLRRP